MIVLSNVRAEAGIYRLRNTITQKKYLGSSGNLRVRMMGHRARLKNLTQRNKELNRDCQLHGSDSFMFEVIVYFDSKDEALDCEQFLLDYYNDNDQWDQLYNQSKDSRTNKGVVHDAEAKIKMSLAKKGRICSSETRRKIAETLSKPVIATCVRTDIITEFSSATEATRQWPGVNNCSISSCCSGKLKTHAKHYWRYL